MLHPASYLGLLSGPASCVCWRLVRVCVYVYFIVMVLTAGLYMRREISLYYN
jgi:hypothetical protein